MSIPPDQFRRLFEYEQEAHHRGLRLPYLRTAVMEWLREPSNPIWLFSVLWFSAFTFIAIPFSILLGGAASVRRGSVESIVN
jgi:hypothetical protein